VRDGRRRGGPNGQSGLWAADLDYPRAAGLTNFQDLVTVMAQRFRDGSKAHKIMCSACHG